MCAPTSFGLGLLGFVGLGAVTQGPLEFEEGFRAYHSIDMNRSMVRGTLKINIGIYLFRPQFPKDQASLGFGIPSFGVRWGSGFRDVKIGAMLWGWGA